MDRNMGENDLMEKMAAVKTAIKAFNNIRPGMNSLLAYCYKTNESIAWKEITKLNFEKDNLNIQSWLKSTLIKHLPPVSIRGFWFGLNSVVPGLGHSSFDLHIAGFSNFNATDHSTGQVQLNGEIYKPEYNAARCAILPKIRDILTKYSVVDTGELVLSLGYACLAIKIAFGSTELMQLPGARGRELVVAYDDERFINLGNLGD